MSENQSVEEIQAAISQLADPAVNTRIELGSTAYVAKRIIETLPGVEELKTSGPEVEKALLDLLGDEDARNNLNLTAIALHILSYYPTTRVKMTLARMIVAGKFTGLSTLLAAEAFLNAAGIQASPDEVIRIAKRKAYEMAGTDEYHEGSTTEKAQTNVDNSDESGYGNKQNKDIQ